MAGGSRARRPAAASKGRPSGQPAHFHRREWRTKERAPKHGLRGRRSAETFIAHLAQPVFHDGALPTTVDGLAEFERELIRARTGEGRHGPKPPASAWGNRRS